MEKRYIYKKILQDCVVPEGLFEIKDSVSDFYLIITYEDDTIKICDLLNEQDQKIKELEKENQQLKQQLSYEEKSHDLCIESLNDECERLSKQIEFESKARKKFQQCQNSKAIEVLEKLRQQFFENPYNGKHEYMVGEVIDKIDIQIIKLKEK